MHFDLKTRGNVQSMMRQVGYYFEKEENGELSFIRSLGSSGSGYPRFHIYVSVSRGTFSDITVNLHLDQKKPSYKGTAAHSGEYEGELISREAERIKNILGP